MEVDEEQTGVEELLADANLGGLSDFVMELPVTEHVVAEANPVKEDTGAKGTTLTVTTMPTDPAAPTKCAEAEPVEPTPEEGLTDEELIEILKSLNEDFICKCSADMANCDPQVNTTRLRRNTNLQEEAAALAA